MATGATPAMALIGVLDGGRGGTDGGDDGVVVV
jgi:hypothetical protein